MTRMHRQFKDDNFSGQASNPCVNVTAICLGLLLAMVWQDSRGGALHQTPSQPTRGPLSPTEAKKAIRLDAALKIELVASDPLIESPVAIAFDEDGRLWVVEMCDYPNGPPKGQPPEGRIRILEDRNGDGIYDHSRVWADKLLFANGLLPWRGGAIVTAAPHISWLRDTDGDGRADQREVLFEGFATENPQLRVNHPVLGLDNWIYVANGLRGGKVRRHGQLDAQPINIGGMDFRFDLIRDRAEAISGPGQYGNTFDDWGRRFVCDNRHHLRHVVLAQHHIKRNPFLGVGQVLQDTSELEMGPAGSGAKVYPLSKNWTTSNLHAGRFTAACSVHIYRGTALPPQYMGDAFTCDPTGNLIHREILRPGGGTFSSFAPNPGTEFLASTDDWFRPVYLADGPDGALYVVDMCRAVIEHPEYMPSELRNRPDLTLGKERGRIWRITSTDRKTRLPQTRLGQARSSDLVNVLDHPNSWQRTTAQRLLLERQNRACIGELRKLLVDGTPQGRLHALWLLDYFDAIEVEALLKLLNDAHPCLREQAVALSEKRLISSPELCNRLIAMADDSDSQVRFQVALALGGIEGDRAVTALAQIALHDGSDEWMRLAVSSSVPARAGSLIVQILQRNAERMAPWERTSDCLHELALVAGARQDASEIAAIVRASQHAEFNTRFEGAIILLNGIAEGMNRRGKSWTQWLKNIDRQHRESLADTVELTFERAAVVCRHERLAMADRMRAVRLLAHAPWEVAERPLTEILATAPQQELRLAAVHALAKHNVPSVGDILMKSWNGATPPLRREMVEAMLRQTDRVALLLSEMEKGIVKPGDLDAIRVRQLVNHSQTPIRERARKILQAAIPSDRKATLEKYRSAAQTDGDALKGRVVFQKNCATCHRIADVGVQVGPDISDTRTKTPAALLEDILNPNQAIDNNYINYLVTTKSGKVLSGMVQVETATSITLQRAENQTDILLRQDIDEIQSTGQSLMPEGLEKNISVAEMADLISFLKNWRYLDGTVPFPTSSKSKK